MKTPIAPGLALAAALASLPAAAEVPPEGISCAEGAEAPGAPASAKGVIRRSLTSFGTKVELGVSGVACGVAEKAYEELYGIFDRLERLTDEVGEDSVIRRINEAAGKEPVEVSAELYALIELALGFSEHTSGAFDPTFAALSGLWRFDGDTSVVPSQADIDARVGLIDWRRVKLDEQKRSVFLEQEGMRLGLRGIVKGYAVDQAVNRLKDLGVQNFIIKTGGEIYVSGNPGGGYRKVGLPDPRAAKNYALIDVRNRALNTSSDNERYFVRDGVRYHHIIDPDTGRPASQCRSVSVISVDATSADALSTAVFVMGPKEGLALVERLAGVEAVIIDSENQVHLSSGLSERIVLGAPTPGSP
ncbi:MAG: FAD:protein FMN transferase [Myxococcota bacterium]